MHAMSYRSDFFLACSFKVNIEEPAFYLTITYPLTVTKIGLRRVQFSTGMSDANTLNAYLLAVMIYSKHEGVIVRYLSDRTFQIIIDGLWASMNVGSERPNAWNNYRHAPVWRFFLYCAIEETGSHGIIYIMGYQVLPPPSEHGPSLMGKHLLAKRISQSEMN
jgi:hypothetical protein